MQSLILLEFTLLSNLVAWLENNSRPCFYKKNFGFDCLGCGFQRAVIELLKGNLIESTKLYPALLPLLATFCFLALHLKFKFNHGAYITKILFISTSTIIVFNFLYKLTLN